MKIQQLYDKEVTRRINPAVVVSEMEQYYINQEIDEYVFTPVITKNIYRFLDAVAHKREGKTGVWISGYYGSGKSHFIKYLFYCLNEKYKEQAFHNFKESVKDIDPLEEPNPSLVTTLEKKLEKLTVEEIIFNIDAVADSDGIKDRITRVLLNQLNEFRGYNNTNIALALYLEKPLNQKGKFQAFQDQVKNVFKENWKGNQLRFIRMYLDKVIEIAQQFDPEIDKQALKTNILDRNQDYTIEFLIDELKDYLSDKDDDYRLLFLIDEVSQYIGSNTSLLLNLQTIIEEIGSKIGTQVWIVCTAQQDLSNLISNTDSKTEDFGKIMGRFETMISLESQDAAYITKRRVLDKKSEGIAILNDYYKDHKGAIENQFVFDHDLYENYGDKGDFILTYPFIPYQFRLISDVFESFSNVGYVGEGVKNTERAILGITHETAKLCKDQEVGYYVSFDLFFNQMLRQHLSHHARGILDRAYNIELVKSDGFAQRTVNALFMISNLGDRQSVNFPANIENLSLLLMNSVDTAKLEIQGEVQKVLDVLRSKNIIQESEGKYRFLKEDEIEVAHLIKSTTVTLEDRLDYVFKNILEKVVKSSSQMGNVSFGNRNFRAAISIDDKEITSRGDFNIKFSVYDTNEIENLALSVPQNDLIIGISEWLRTDKELKSQLLEYVRTQKYISNQRGNATGTRVNTLEAFNEVNKTLLEEIKLRFTKKFLETPIVSNQNVTYGNELNGSIPSVRFDDMVNRHLEVIYRKHHLSNGYATSNTTLISNAKSKQKETYKDLTPAEDELNNKLNLLGEAPVVGDVVKLFEKSPYGWKDLATLDILLRIAKKGIRRFEWKNEEIDLPTYADKALNSRERDSITIHSEKVHSQEEVSDFIQAVNDYVFAETIIPSSLSDFKEAVETFKTKVQPKVVRLNDIINDYEQYAFVKPVKSYHISLKEILTARNNENLVEQFISQKAVLKQSRDSYMNLEEFLKDNFKAFSQIAKFVENNQSNFEQLDETLSVQADGLISYLKQDQTPWDKFPQFKKLYKELHQAIKDRLNTLRKEVVAKYETIFNEVDEHRKKLGIETPNLTTDPDSYLNLIRMENHISKLEIYDLQAHNFRAKCFKILEDHKAQEEAKKKGGDYVASHTVSIANEMPPTPVETPEQLDEYLKKLRERLMVKLSKNQKLFLN